MNPRRGSIAVGLIALIGVGGSLAVGSSQGGPVEAAERHAEVARAHVDVAVAPDGTLRVTEDLRYRFSGGTFHEAHRDIADALNSRLADFAINDGGLPYENGASTTLGSGGGLPGTFGEEQLPNGTERVVWHFDHSGAGQQDFRLSYRAEGAVEAYRDVVFVHWVIWGDQWPSSLDDLSGAIHLESPASGDGRPIRAWTTPSRVDARPAVGGEGATVAMRNVPAHQQIELSALFLRSDFATAVDDALYIPGTGRTNVIAREDSRPLNAGDEFGDWALGGDEARLQTPEAARAATSGG